ncbi:hypothetical protein RRG08_044280 [Elysia crispata]|uniref:Uncharacterized protein n=1 Tax=Elysia crispata TaxID=231223 RepID=A0AAE0XXB6_9GAST|nr:hypothetical protein RRG08_044280 [Elysia crispata]
MKELRASFKPAWRGGRSKPLVSSPKRDGAANETGNDTRRGFYDRGEMPSLIGVYMTIASGATGGACQRSYLVT